MIDPNLYTLDDVDGTFGLHKFKDGQAMIVKQHKCGDWFTLRPPRPHEVEHFEKHGQKVEMRKEKQS